MTQEWDKEKSEFLTGVEPMTSRTPGLSSIHRGTRSHGEQGYLTEFICDSILHSAMISTVKVIVSVISEQRW